MSTNVPVTKAKFTAKTGSDTTPFDVHFNPVSLQYTVTNTLKEEGSGKTKKQYVTQGTGKLTMDLVFDNTSDGQDVRIATQKIADLMTPDPKASGGKKQVASIVLFEWGKYKFQGMMESFKETIDFFSPSGVPLRASVNITLVEQDKIFETASADTSGALTPDAVDVPNGAGSDATSLARQGGDPGAARAIASLNGQASMRFSAGASLTLSGSITLGPPAAFASASAGIGIGGGIGISGGIGTGAGIGIGVSAGAGISFGGSASAGISASEGAFAGLRVSTSSPSVTLDTNRFLPRPSSISISTGSNATFQVGGKATVTGSAGLGADVGAAADLQSRIQFEVK